MSMNRALCLFAALCPLSAAAQINLVPDPETQSVFTACTQTVRVALRNHTDSIATSDVVLKLFQLTTGRAVPVGGPRSWKTITVLPQQTILENLALALPDVRASTRYRVELIGIGAVEVIAYPTNLLRRLGALAGDQPLGVFDPDGKLKPILKQAGVSIADFEIEPGESRLAIIWSDVTNLPDSIASRVKKGMAAVWIRSSPIPTTYAVHLGEGVVIVAAASSMRGLTDSPSPQLNLIHDAELALQPDVFRLPSDNPTQ